MLTSSEGRPPSRHLPSRGPRPVSPLCPHCQQEAWHRGGAWGVGLEKAKGPHSTTASPRWVALPTGLCLHPPTSPQAEVCPLLLLGTRGPPSSSPLLLRPLGPPPTLRLPLEAVWSGRCTEAGKRALQGPERTDLMGPHQRMRKLRLGEQAANLSEVSRLVGANPRRDQKQADDWPAHVWEAAGTEDRAPRLGSHTPRTQALAPHPCQLCGLGQAAPFLRADSSAVPGPPGCPAGVLCSMRLE